jgi:deoxyribonuclease V
MDIDYGKIDDCTLALLRLVSSRGPFGARAWKSFELETLNRLQTKGYIADLQSKSPSVVLSEEGKRGPRSCLRSSSPSSGGSSGRRMRKLHEWNLSYAEARRVQGELAGRVKVVPLAGEPQVVAGLDCAFSKDGKTIFAAAVVLRVAGSGPSRLGGPVCLEFEMVETAAARQRTRFPYIPGLLSFREAPVCLAAVGKLTWEPDLFLIDGQGQAHPRRLGLASHLGLFLDRPTIGCAKSRLIGTYEEPGGERGAYSLLRDGDETIGAVVRTRSRVKPLFVSIGHRCTLPDAIRVTLACATRYRIPEPTRLAHQAVGRLR